MLPVNIAQWGRSSLRVEVWNREPFITDDFLGQVTLPLKAMTPESWDEEAVIHREAMAPLPLTAKHECEKRNATPGEAQTQAGGKAAVLGGSGHGGGMTTAKLRIGVRLIMSPATTAKADRLPGGAQALQKQVVAKQNWRTAFAEVARAKQHLHQVLVHSAVGCHRCARWYDRVHAAE